MIEAQRSSVQKAVRAAVVEHLGDILADGDITEEMRPGYADAMKAFLPEDDDDAFDEGVAELQRGGAQHT